MAGQTWSWRVSSEPEPISWFDLRGDPLDPANWVEHELTRVPWPINSQPVDLDGDGDLDVLGGSVAESRIFWFENVTEGEIRFREHRIEMDRTSIPAADRPPGQEGNDRALVTGFNVDFADLDHDGRLDVVLAEDFRYLVWLEQPESPTDIWRLHTIGHTVPDQLVGLAVADMDGDGDVDFVSTRGNSSVWDGVFWLEQVRSPEARPAFERAREIDSPEMPLPPGG